MYNEDVLMKIRMQWTLVQKESEISGSHNEEKEPGEFDSSQDILNEITEGKSK